MALYVCYSSMCIFDVSHTWKASCECCILACYISIMQNCATIKMVNNKNMSSHEISF